MSYEFNPEEVKDCLAKCIVSGGLSGGLRKILAKAGIPESEPAKLNIKCVDIDLDVVKDYEIPITTPQVSVTPTETNCEQEIKDFLNQAETDHGLLSALPKSDPSTDGSTRTSFEFTLDSSIVPPKSVSFPACICCTPRACDPC